MIDTQLTYEVLDVIDVLSFEIYFRQAIPRKKKTNKETGFTSQAINENLRGELLSSSIRKYLDIIHIPKQPLNILSFSFFFGLLVCFSLTALKTDDVSNRKLMISKHIFEQRPSTGSGLLSFLDSC